MARRKRPEKKESQALLSLRVEALAAPAPSPKPPNRLRYRRKQQEFLKAYQRNLGVVTKTCEDVGIAVCTYYRWLHNPKHAEWRRKLEAIPIETIKKDVVETSLLSLVAEKHPYATVFAARTRLRDRGYGEDPREVQADDDGLLQLRQQIALLARQEGRTVQEMTALILEEFADQIKPAYRRQLEAAVESAA